MKNNCEPLFSHSLLMEKEINIGYKCHINEFYEKTHTVDEISIFTEKVQHVLLGKTQYHSFFNLNVHVRITVREGSNSKPAHFIKALSPKASLLCYFHINPVRERSC